MGKEIVEWLRDHARRCEQSAIADKWRLPDDRSPRSFEAEYARQFADEIERRFVNDESIAKLANMPSSFPPTRIQPTSALDVRRRKRQQLK